jgi:hypothetical protein
MMIQIISFGKGGLLNLNFKPSVVFLYCLPKPLGDDAKTISHLQLNLVLFFLARSILGVKMLYQNKI